MDRIHQDYYFIIKYIIFLTIADKLRDQRKKRIKIIFATAANQIHSQC